MRWYNKICIWIMLVLNQTAQALYQWHWFLYNKKEKNTLNSRTALWATLLSFSRQYLPVWVPVAVSIVLTYYLPKIHKSTKHSKSLSVLLFTGQRKRERDRDSSVKENSLYYHFSLQAQLQSFLILFFFCSFACCILYKSYGQIQF